MKEYIYVYGHKYGIAELIWLTMHGHEVTIKLTFIDTQYATYNK